MTARRSHVSSLVAGLVLASVVGRGAGRAQDSLPPAYPRQGAVKALENARVVVWDITWLKQQYPLHRHRFDLAGVYYAPGDRTIVAPTASNGRSSTG